MAGLMGAAGVALAAAAAHLAASGQAPNLQLASGFLIFHALALLGVAALTRATERWLRIAGALFSLGSLCFSGGLALVAAIGQGGRAAGPGRRDGADPGLDRVIGIGRVRSAADYLILASLKTTCLRTTGSYFLNSSFSVLVRGFFFVT